MSAPAISNNTTRPSYYYCHYCSYCHVAITTLTRAPTKNNKKCLTSLRFELTVCRGASLMLWPLHQGVKLRIYRPSCICASLAIVDLLRAQEKKQSVLWGLNQRPLKYNRGALTTTPKRLSSKISIRDSFGPALATAESVQAPGWLTKFILGSGLHFFLSFHFVFSGYRNTDRLLRHWQPSDHRTASTLKITMGSKSAKILVLILDPISIWIMNWNFKLNFCFSNQLKLSWPREKLCTSWVSN